jgi:hypothetical protein
VWYWVTDIPTASIKKPSTGLDNFEKYLGRSTYMKYLIFGVSFAYINPIQDVYVITVVSCGNSVTCDFSGFPWIRYMREKFGISTKEMSSITGYICPLGSGYIEA